MGTALVSGEAHEVSVDIKRVAFYQPFVWLYRGWKDLQRHWGASLGYGGLIVALGWTLLSFCATHPYYVAAAISGFLLVGPVMSAGLCEMSRRDAQGGPANFEESLEGFARNPQALFEFGVILAVCAVVWFALSAVMLNTVFHIAAPSLQETLFRGFIDSANRSQVQAYVVVGGALAAAVFAVSVVAIPLMIDRHARPGAAVSASLRAVLANLPAMLVWSALILLLTVAGYAPLLFGLLLTAPLLGHATWHAYKDLVS